jgi:MFS family permease
MDSAAAAVKAAAPAAPSALARFVASQTDGIPRTFWLLWAGTMINRAGAFVVPFLAIYLTKQRHLTPEQIGIAVALIGLGSAISSTLGGFLADRVGRRFTMLFGLTSGAVAMLALGFARTLPQICVAIFLLGLLADLYRPASQATIADVVPPQHRMKAFGLLYWAINLGFSVAALIAGFVAPFSYTALFVGDAITTLICAAIIWRGVPETRPTRAPDAKRQSELRGLVAPFLDTVFLPFFLLSFGVALIFMQHNVTLPIQMQETRISERWYGLIIAVNGALIVTTQPFLTRRLAGHPRSRILAAAALLTGLGFGMYALAVTVPYYAAAVAVWTFGEIIMAPANASVVADLAPADSRGRYQGAWVLSWAASAFLAPTIGAWVMHRFGGGVLWGGCLAIGIGCAVGQLAIAKKRRERVRALVGDAARAD